jgi:amino-acid N-acetyltransferase
VSVAPAMVYRNDDRHSRTVTGRPAAIVPARVVVRSAVTADAEAIHRLIIKHAVEGRLLARSRDEVGAHIDRFVVAAEANRVVGCVDLAPLSASIAEVRSLVVDSAARANGIGRKLLDQLQTRAAAAGFDVLCAFTHSPGYFVNAGFSIVPHAWLPEKIHRDCQSCSLFRRCGQYAMALTLGAMISDPGRSDLTVGLDDVDMKAGHVNG